MTTRRQFIALGAGALAMPTSGWAQQAPAHARLGILFPGTQTTGEDYYRAFFESLATEGYVEGRNLAVERRFANGQPQRLDALARELVGAKVNVIYAPPTPAAMAAKKASQTVPVVFSMSSDPVGAGLVTSLSRPDANVTGLSTLGRELAPKRVELLRELVPGIRRMALLYDLSREPHTINREAARRTAQSFGVAVVEQDVRTREQIPAAFTALKEKRVEAVLVFEGALVLSNSDMVIKHAAINRIPALYTYPEFPSDGGLMSYSASVVEQYRRAAVVVAKLLRGAKPGDLPIEQPTKFELVINTKTARALGLKIPNSLLVQANKVIE